MPNYLQSLAQGQSESLVQFKHFDVFTIQHVCVLARRNTEMRFGSLPEPMRADKNDYASSYLDFTLTAPIEPTLSFCRVSDEQVCWCTGFRGRNETPRLGARSTFSAAMVIASGQCAYIDWPGESALEKAASWNRASVSRVEASSREPAGLSSTKSVTRPAIESHSFSM